MNESKKFQHGPASYQINLSSNAAKSIFKLKIPKRVKNGFLLRGRWRTSSADFSTNAAVLGKGMENDVFSGPPPVQPPTHSPYFGTNPLSKPRNHSTILTNRTQNAFCHATGHFNF